MEPRITRNFLWKSFWAVTLIGFIGGFPMAFSEDECPEQLYFKCHSGSCISRSFICDGQVDCHDDSSDEDQSMCNNTQVYHSKVECSENQWVCKDGQCIEHAWLCDSTIDCPDGSDEDATMCKSLNMTCDGFLCEPEKKCILKESVCDGNIDCKEGTDESSCEYWIQSSPKCKIAYSMFQCNDSKRCLHVDQVCNGKPDCIDGSDEHPNCNITGCQGSCTHASMCKSFPTGPMCLCNHGEEFDLSGNCHDINECTSESNPAHCDQICTNTPGSYTCSCKKGYTRKNETCKAEGEGMLLFATKDEVRLFYLTSHVYDRIATNVNHSSAVTSDGEYVYWATYENGEEAIFRATETGTSLQMIFTAGLGLVEDICIDWITKNIYFTDSVYKHIAVCTEDGRKCTSLITDNIHKPRALVLHSTVGVMFFTDWGTIPRISKVGMDGSGLVDIATDDIKWPNGLAIDHGTDRLYWADAYLEKVYHVNFDGSDRKTLHIPQMNHPYSIDIFEDTIYWSDMGDHEIHSCQKLTGTNYKSVLRHAKEMILGIHVYHPILLEDIRNPCTDAKCSHLCLLAPIYSTGYSCACPSGMELSSNKHSCTQLERTQNIIIGSGSSLYVVLNQPLGKFDIQDVTNHRVPHIGSISYDFVADQIIISNDLANGSVTLYDLSSKSVKTVFHVDTREITDMDFDPLGYNLFWIDGLQKTAGLTNLNKFESAVLIRDFGGETPLAISLYPDEGTMYIALRNDDSSIHIDQFSMDGSTASRIRRVSDHIVGPSVSLFFDSHSGRLFWSDLGSGKIMSMDKDGADSHELITLSYSSLVDVISIDNDVFWTVMHSNEIFWTSKSNPTTIKHMKIGELDGALSLKMVKTGGAPVKNHEGCLLNNGGCSHICLAIHGKHECKCPDSLSMADDGNNCIKKRSCEVDEFQCSNGHCLPMHVKCDTMRDCPLGEDEIACHSFTCPIGTFPCKNGLQCIEHHGVCDSVRNCDDGSDEDDCQSKPMCSPVEFHCQSGECIHIAWKCDDKSDCIDGSDEHDCKSNKCETDEFRCLSGLCIPLNWECDGEVDCADMTDEHSHCNLSKPCHDNEMHCKNGHCVDEKLICDGEDDCEDGSDEVNCKRKPITQQIETQTCKVEEFQCASSNSCITISSRCNGKAECLHGEDEKGCEGCGVEEFQCETAKTCISIKWKCDGVNDCIDHSDEKDCPKTATSVYHTSETCHGIKCRDTGFCIEWKRVCNNESDCVDHSDEGGACGKSCTNSGCELCHETPLGFHCSCPEGYRLMNDGKRCVDVDECGIPSSCSQFCRNTIGSFTCSCKEEYYHLRTDRVTCKARGPEMEYIFATHGEIRYKSGSLNNVDLAFKSPLKLTVKGLDVDMNARVVYWSSEVEGILYKTPLGDMEGTEMITQIAKPGRVTYDWISGLIYLTERDTHIRTCDFTLKRCATVVECSKDVTIDALRLDGTSRCRRTFIQDSTERFSQPNLPSEDRCSLETEGELDMAMESITKSCERSSFTNPPFLDTEFPFIIPEKWLIGLEHVTLEELDQACLNIEHDFPILAIQAKELSMNQRLPVKAKYYVQSEIKTLITQEEFKKTFELFSIESMVRILCLLPWEAHSKIFRACAVVLKQSSLVSPDCSNELEASLLFAVYKFLKKTKHIFLVFPYFLINVRNYVSKEISHVRKLYWSETSKLGSQDSKGVIKRADLSGGNIIILQADGIHKVTDIVVDEMRNTLYYTDSLGGKVRRLSLDSKMANTVMFSVQGKPMDLNLFEGQLYWLSRMKSGGEVGSLSRNNIISKCGVSGTSYMECDNVRLLPEYSSSSIQRFRISHSALQPTGIDHCVMIGVNCKHLCISEEKGPVCICEDGIRVKSGQNCPIPVVKLRNHNKIPLHMADGTRHLKGIPISLQGSEIDSVSMKRRSPFLQIRQSASGRCLHSLHSKGTITQYKFSNFMEVLNLAKAHDNANQTIGAWWWFMILIMVVSFTISVIYTVYYFYSKNVQQKNGFNSVHFQNPSYELDGQNQLAPYELRLSPGQHQYENPISFKPCNDSGNNNNTLKITRGEDGIWPSRENRNPEEFTHIPEPNILL